MNSTTDFFNVPPLQEEPAKEKKHVSFYRVRSTDLVLERPILKQGDITLMGKGNISIIKGREKSGKSTTMSVFIATIFGCDSYGMTSHLKEPKALIVDTEMDKFDNVRFLRMSEKLADIESGDNLVSLLVNELSPIEIREMLEDAIIEYKPDVMFVDGLLDLSKNMNDVEDANLVIDLIRQLAVKYDIHICMALHESKTSGQLLGHLGSVAVRKCQTVFQLTNTDGTIKVSPGSMRGKPFVEFYLAFDEQGIPRYDGEVIVVPKEVKAKKNPQSILTSTHEQILVQVFEIATEQTYKELRDNIRERFATVMDTTLGVTYGEQFVAFYKNNGYIIPIQKKNKEFYKIGKLVINSKP